MSKKFIESIINILKNLKVKLHIVEEEIEYFGREMVALKRNKIKTTFEK